MKTKIILLTTLVLMTFTSYSQYDGATPWSNCFGKNASCKSYGCSDIIVKTSNSSPVVAIVKRNNKVIKHAYISAGSSYTFEVIDGTYEVFFYYGTSWNKNKKMPSGECSSLYGGWNYDESVSKDGPFRLKGQFVEYTLSQMVNGNFIPDKSNIKEAL